MSHMDSHYSQVDEIQEAVIAGNVDGTRGPARWISTHRGQEFPATASSSLEMMRTEGRIMLEQTQILEVAQTLGRMGVACGSCHTALDAGVNYPIVEPPASSPAPQAHMQRHAWAVDRLWEGLAAPSDASWRAGAGALTHMPVDFGTNDQANRLAQRVHELSAKASSATQPKARAEVYGQLLETCALCHGALRMRMR
jgi:cytochrome c556